MQGVGDAEINDRNGGVLEESAVIVIHRGDAVATGHLFGASPGPARNRADLHGNGLDLPVGAKMKRGGKARPHDSHYHRRTDDRSSSVAE